MLDNPKNTFELMKALEAALPFEVELTPEVIESLRKEKPALVVESRQSVSGLSYFGNEGGIMCHIVPKDSPGNPIIISITHVRMSGKHLLARDVFKYQKHRVKKLRKQIGA